MTLNLHNSSWNEVRLVQVATQPHHITGLFATIQDTLRTSNSEWQEVISAFYECVADGTVTFYEAESQSVNHPQVWTYLLYDCAADEEEVITNPNINTLEPALQLLELAGIG
ncbi:hypothetical protein [Chroococcus sp. FPU101]|uniref:hypothetical protein n=1 Tax=Chroococcus sp. FPU101 TaxID=1974212 RepID=UPI001A8C9F77|nr:hypothetical protein [Chroococcus sp. FPU101]GFE68133.1 conserved hypothetical protein [Chroococcus sp. FPU101]